jgi:hypothetical protein
MQQLEEFEVGVRQGVLEVPREEDGHALCVYWTDCAEPLQDGDTDAYFRHLRQHAQAQHKLLTNMIATTVSNNNSVTIWQRRAELAAVLEASKADANNVTRRGKPRKRQRKTDVIDHGFDDLVGDIQVSGGC